MLTIPNWKIASTDKVSEAFINLHIKDFASACHYVKDLPYRRTANREEILSVLTESCGTCSSKHALLKTLADENNYDVDLYVGIFHMNEQNTPGVGTILTKAGLTYIPEAHCYLKYKDNNKDTVNKATAIDITGLASGSTDVEIVEEIQILPSQITTFKESYHKDYITTHFSQNELTHLWKVRELCIQALSS